MKAKHAKTLQAVFAKLTTATFEWARIEALLISLGCRHRSQSMNTLTYQGYTARIEFDDRDNTLVGRLLGIQDIVGFHADNVADLRLAFEEAVDDYREGCEKVGKSPEKPYSGKLMLQVPPEVHAHAVLMAEAHGKSLNQWAAEVLGNAR